jgi:hypothetical protein
VIVTFSPLADAPVVLVTLPVAEAAAFVSDDPHPVASTEAATISVRISARNTARTHLLLLEFMPEHPSLVVILLPV